MSKDTIYREDAIKAIEELPNAYNGWSDAYDKAYIISTLEEVPSADRPQEWIPCSERHPKDGRYYVTRIDYVTNTIFTDILWYEKGIWWNRQYTGDFAVIAWMPLPKPWKGSDDETD